MKKLRKIISSFIVLLATVSLVACGGGGSGSGDGGSGSPALLEFSGVTFDSKTVNYDGYEHELLVSGDLPSGTEVQYTNNKGTEEGDYNAKAVLSKEGYKDKTLNATLKIEPPTSNQIVLARQNVVNQTYQGYDYKFVLEGAFSVLGIDAAVDATYTASYRQNKTTGEENFKRVTSGELLFDSTHYVYTKGNQKINVKMDDDNTVKKVSVQTVDDEETMYVHKPVVALIDGLNASEIKNIQKNPNAKTDGYKYVANLQFSTQNEKVNKVLGLVGKLGTNVSIKGATVTNPVNGIKLLFNYGKTNKLDDFYLAINVTVPIKEATASVTLSYEQNPSTSQIQIPNAEGLIIEDSQIASQITTINNALTSLKSDDAYSLDVEAKNEFDPSWKDLAITDKYVARLYKNTVDGEVYFNHSYMYKAHHEEDGAENYKYTLGNVIGEEAGVYLVSRKGSNVVSPIDSGKSVDTQFDYLTAMALINADNVDCIRKDTKDGVTTYKVYINSLAAVSVQEKIIGIINSNDAEGVVDVNNYFNQDFTLKDALIEVKMQDGKIKSIKCETELKYVPTGGDYTAYNITLNNLIEIKVNDKLDKALEYTAPSSTGKIVGIGASKYYVL